MSEKSINEWENEGGSIQLTPKHVVNCTVFSHLGSEQIKSSKELFNFGAYYFSYNSSACHLNRSLDADGLNRKRLSRMVQMRFKLRH